MSDCILCGEPLPIESFLRLQGMPSCAQNIPDKDSLYKDRGMDLNLFQCGSCGLVQLDCRPVSYYRDVIRAGGGTKTMTDLRRSQYRHFIDKCSLVGKRVLEVGCGQGEFLEMLKDFAQKKEATPAQISLAWMLHKYPNVVPIPGSKNKERIVENLNSSNVELTDEEFTALEESLNALKVYGHRGLGGF